jgi:glycerol kinase
VGQYVLALDQGTTSSRAIVFDRAGAPVARGQRELPQIYPRPGWVEHDPRAILATQLDAAREALARARIGAEDLAALGIANQRETVVVWDRHTGEPVTNAIVWQCRRSAPLCAELVRAGHAELIRARTGLVVDAYFSGSKIRWVLEHVPGARRKADAGDLLFGTVDTWLLWNLTGGAVHTTDPSNASRTMLYNIHERDWDEELLSLFGIPRAMLPGVSASGGSLGMALPEFLGAPVPIASAIGDQQAALFGQCCFAEGSAKNTYGTGCFALMNTGPRPVASAHGLLTTVAWEADGRFEYALEGSVFVAGAAVQWLRDEMGLVGSSAETEELARSVPDTNGAYLVPAFVGLGAPHWDMTARGALVGLTRGVGRAHVVRACLEAIAYQAAEVLAVMASDSGTPTADLRVDGGASANDFLMQFQADILGVPVVRPAEIETTARGAAFLAGLAVGFWESREELAELGQADARRFGPSMAHVERERLLSGWRRAVDRARGWVE